MLQVIEDLSTSLVNLVRSLCLMVYNSSKSTQVSQTIKCTNTGLQKGRRIRKGENANRQAHDDGFDAYFQNVFDNTEYEAKDKDEIKFNQAKIPKIHHQARHCRVAKKESKVSMNQIKVQLRQKGGRKIHRSKSQILGIEREDKIPKGILRRAKKHRQELNPELLLPETPRPLRVKILLLF
ncbi:Hypothetical predicted protein [Paramuricea clavata]|uniref:Uncharacterized protein n=1 Tax=Paramuricea clavata TaxID=317549 RepID=A0A6S7FH81_PARCT|nr:Hypothetical predicted protein [Paramuricea clavata]